MTTRFMLALFSSPSWPEQKSPEVPSELPPQPQSNTMAVTFVNHATFVIQNSDLVILTDPVWAERVSPFSWAGPKRAVPPGIDFEKLRKVDVVIISHNHYDHMDIESLKRLKEKFDPLFVIPLGDSKHLQKEGISKFKELDWWEEAQIPGATITLTPAQHFSSRSLFDRNKSLWGSYWVEFKNHKVYFGGDTGYSAWFKEIHKRFGSPDLALLPIGAYEPRWFMKPVHMNPEEAVLAHIDLNSKQSIGMHFGTFKLTTEAIDQPAKDLAQSLRDKAIDPKTFLVPTEGFSFYLSDKSK